ncbi:MAG TPA: imidazoleglycerol-phosphate dehydratase [Gemmatimonadales bacterium]|nr:imidazoleglycerol-phosphate dehydratase [Gemmatimonadales bacterium]
MSLDIDSTPAASSTMSAEGTAERVVRLRRETSETRIALRLSVGDGRAKVATTNAFLDHMLVTFARYTGVDLELDASGDLTHHLVEDVAITLGEALRRFVPPTAARYGDRVVPMDDALVHVAVDLGGRPYYAGRLPSRLYTHFMRSLADNARATVHVRVLRGSDRHHVVEAAIKALGLACREALAEGGAVFSTKGAVLLEDE